MAEKILDLAAKGLTDAKIAKKLGIALSTLSLWKGKHAEFSEALADSKDIADELVVAALLQRALGYRHKATKFFCHEGVIVKEIYTEVYAPDVGAITMWLKNRRPKEWRDAKQLELVPKEKLTEEQLNAIAAQGDDDAS